MRPIILSVLGAALVSLLTSCASAPKEPQQSQQPVAKPMVVQRSDLQAHNNAPINLHTGRYTVVSTEPVPEQLQLATQIVDIQIPARMAGTVKDGMTYLLSRTGYVLCDGRWSADVEHLYRLPLPAVHYQIGPTKLIRALQVLAGPTYEVKVDEVNRVICFALKQEYKKGASK